MAAAVTGQKSYLPALQFAGNEDIRGIAEWRAYLNLVRVAKAGHGIEPAAAYDSDFRLLQARLRARVNCDSSQVYLPGWCPFAFVAGGVELQIPRLPRISC